MEQGFDLKSCREQRIRYARNYFRVHVQVLKYCIPKVVTISGKPEHVTCAKKAVQSAIELKIMESKQRRETTVLIPDGSVGKLIGRRGTNIRYIQRQSGASIVVDDGGVACADRVCVVSGSPKQIKEALMLMEASVPGVASSHDNKLIPASLPNTSDYFAGLVSAVDVKGGVWIQPMERDDPELLETLVEKMTAHYSKLSGEEGCVRNVVVGCECAAPFEHDGSWYRAVITLAPTSEMVDVLYVDYGDSGVVHSRDLKLLRFVF